MSGKGPRLRARHAAYYRRRADELDHLHPERAQEYRVMAAELEATLVASHACRACGRPLEDPESQRRGVGPDCWEKPDVRARFEGDLLDDHGYTAVSPGRLPGQPQGGNTVMTTATAATEGPQARPQLHDSCPKCGFKFPKPQTGCRSKSACERRQAGGGATGSGRTTPRGTQPRGEGRTARAQARVEGVNRRLREAREAKAVEGLAGGATIVVLRPEPSEANPEAEATDTEKATNLLGAIVDVLGGADPEATADALVAESGPAPVTGKPVRVQLTSASMEEFVDAVMGGETGLRSGRAGHWLVIQEGERDAVLDAFRAAHQKAPKGPKARTAYTVVTRIVNA